jgi:hypothetical protein
MTCPPGKSTNEGPPNKTRSEKISGDPKNLTLDSNSDVGHLNSNKAVKEIKEKVKSEPPLSI